MVVHPRAGSDEVGEPPMMQPVNPVAAAMTNQRPLALPVRAADTAPAPEQAADTAIVTPKVVAMPRPPRQIMPAPVMMASADTGRVVLPEVAQVPPPVAPVAAARIEPAALAPRAAAPAPVAPVAQAPAPPEPARMMVASISVPPALARSAVAPSAVTPVALGRMVRRDAGPLAVQFAATGTEESANAFWQSLVRRFPELLGQRELSLIRFERHGTVFWRVRTEGFETFADARALCGRIHATGQACFVARF
jgi:hypothetical protein